MNVSSAPCWPHDTSETSLWHRESMSQRSFACLTRCRPLTAIPSLRYDLHCNVIYSCCVCYFTGSICDMLTGQKSLTAFARSTNTHDLWLGPVQDLTTSTLRLGHLWHIMLTVTIYLSMFNLSDLTSCVSLYPLTIIVPPHYQLLPHAASTSHLSPHLKTWRCYLGLVNSHGKWSN